MLWYNLLCSELTIAGLFVNNLKILALELVKLVARMRADWLTKVAISHRIREIQTLVLEILNNPRKHRILGGIIKTPMRYKIEIKQIISICQHTALPRMLVVLNICKHVIVYILTHGLNLFVKDLINLYWSNRIFIFCNNAPFFIVANQDLKHFMRMLYFLKFKNELICSLGHNSDRFVLKQITINMDYPYIVQLYLNLLRLVRSV